MFRLITDPFHLAQFHGPHGVTNRISEMDVRPGELLAPGDALPDGSDYPSPASISRWQSRSASSTAMHLTGSTCDLADLPPAQLKTSFFFDDLGGKATSASAGARDLACRASCAYGFAEAMCQGNEKPAAYLTTL